MDSVPGYRLGRVLGRGGFATVFAAERAADASPMALKLATSPGDPRFQREATALARIGPPAVPALFEHGVADGHPWLAMELLDGSSLAERLAGAREAGGSPAALDLVDLFPAVCAAVQAVHQRGFVHRDLKPANVFLRRDGGVTLIDLGLAIPAGDLVDDGDQTLTRTGQRPGTVPYMAPEQLRAERRFTPATDVYALGVILFELVTGRLPFVGSRVDIEQAHLVRRPPRVSQLASWAAPLDPVLARCLAKGPSARHASVGDLQADVERARRELRVSTAPTPAAPGTAPPTAAPVLRRPVALLYLHTSAALPEVTAAVEREQGVFVKAISGGYLAAFPSASSASGAVRLAMAAGRRLLAGGRRSVVHLVEARVRRNRVLDPLSDEVDLPGEGLLLTPAAAAALGSQSTSELSTHPTGAGVDLGSPTAPLVGRQTLLERLLASARDAFTAAAPSLATLTGEAGLGRTRALGEIADRLRGEATVVALVARRPSDRDHHALVRQLLDAAFGSVLRSAEEVRAATVGCLGPAGEEVWPAVAALLELAGDADPRVARMRDAPGALRQAAARVISAGLRQRAGRRPLALLLDDAQFADQTSLDGLELATLADGDARLWVCVAASPTLFDMRPSWGDRAARHQREALVPLDEASARRLLVELFRPVEYVPEPLLRRIADRAGGVPGHLVDVVTAARARGAVRRQPGADAWFVAADDLLEVTASSLGEAFAVAALDRLPPDLRRFAQLCAVMDDPLLAGELDAVQAELGGDEIDSAVGLERLARGGLLSVDREGAVRFAQPAVRDAFERLLLDDERRSMHAAALRQLLRPEAAGPSELVRIARHAAAIGDGEHTARACLALARRARDAHQDDEAERAFSQALAHLGEDAFPARIECLTGRGIARLRSWRLRDALDDIRAAGALAEAYGDRRSVAELLLEEATILDWRNEYADEASVLERARAAVEPLGDPALDLRLAFARGRILYRQERLAEAIEVLEPTASTAAERGDHQTHRLALLMLAPILAFTGAHRESEERFRQALEACQAAGDRLHLGASYANRLVLWLVLGDYQRALADATAANELAREVGNAQLERAAQYNVAELLHYMGRHREALAPALRARDLEARFFENPGQEGALLAARVQVALGDLAAAEKATRAVRGSGVALSPMLLLLLRSVELVVAAAGPAEWEAVLTEARELPFRDERLEIMCLAAGAAGEGDRARRILAEAREVAGDAAIWLDRLAALEA